MTSLNFIFREKLSNRIIIILTNPVNISIEDELLDKINKLRGDISLNKFIEDRLKECIEQYETKRYYNREFPADRFRKNEEIDN